ncbi:hypothetical protein HDV00_001446 [Rhizophlyctis rosea]|nr:hypothetical protein HDV00_001446 [Rhizophlyctis rosea]
MAARRKTSTKEKDSWDQWDKPTDPNQETNGLWSVPTKPREPGLTVADLGLKEVEDEIEILTYEKQSKLKSRGLQGRHQLGVQVPTRVLDRRGNVRKVHQEFHPQTLIPPPPASPPSKETTQHSPERVPLYVQPSFESNTPEPSPPTPPTPPPGPVNHVEIESWRNDVKASIPDPTAQESPKLKSWDAKKKTTDHDLNGLAAGARAAEVGEYTNNGQSEILAEVDGVNDNASSDEWDPDAEEDDSAAAPEVPEGDRQVNVYNLEYQRKNLGKWDAFVARAEKVQKDERERQAAMEREELRAQEESLQKKAAKWNTLAANSFEKLEREDPERAAQVPGGGDLHRLRIDIDQSAARVARHLKVAAPVKAVSSGPSSANSKTVQPAPKPVELPSDLKFKGGNSKKPQYRWPRMPRISPEPQDQTSLTRTAKPAVKVGESDALSGHSFEDAWTKPAPEMTNDTFPPLISNSKPTAASSGLGTSSAWGKSPALPTSRANEFPPLRPTSPAPKPAPAPVTMPKETRKPPVAPKTVWQAPPPHQESSRRNDFDRSDQPSTRESEAGSEWTAGSRPSTKVPTTDVDEDLAEEGVFGWAAAEDALAKQKEIAKEHRSLRAAGSVVPSTWASESVAGRSVKSEGKPMAELVPPIQDQSMPSESESVPAAATPGQLTDEKQVQADFASASERRATPPMHETAVAGSSGREQINPVIEQIAVREKGGDLESVPRLGRQGPAGEGRNSNTPNIAHASPGLRDGRQGPVASEAASVLGSKEASKAAEGLRNTPPLSPPSSQSPQQPDLWTYAQQVPQYAVPPPWPFFQMQSKIFVGERPSGPPPQSEPPQPSSAWQPASSTWGSSSFPEATTHLHQFDAHFGRGDSEIGKSVWDIATAPVSSTPQLTSPAAEWRYTIARPHAVPQQPVFSPPVAAPPSAPLPAALKPTTAPTSVPASPPAPTPKEGAADQRKPRLSLKLKTEQGDIMLCIHDGDDPGEAVTRFCRENALGAQAGKIMAVVMQNLRKNKM